MLWDNVFYISRLTIFFCAILISQSVENEVFSALADLEELIQTESHLITALENYITVQEQQLSVLKKFASTYRINHNQVLKNTEDFVSNPVNGYILIKKFLVDWEYITELITENLSEDFVETLQHVKSDLKYPNDEDLNGAASALSRLQQTYKLETSSLASGIINDAKYSPELSVSDCFHIGKELHKNQEYFYSLLWMKEAYNRIIKIGSVRSEEYKADILEHLSFNSLYLGNLEAALNYSKEILETLPSHKNALENIAYITNLSESSKSELIVKSNHHKLLEKDNLTLIYEKLCREEVMIPVEVSSKLKCYFGNLGYSVLSIIAPFKIEEAYKDPDIFVFHDVMCDEEIEVIKNLAKPHLKRATVGTPDVAKPTSSRIAKVTWISDWEHESISKISRRVRHMTGLSVETAESLQVLNYGIGGHYKTHYDFLVKGKKDKIAKEGNRIGTVVFYLSDVPVGGNTVFPRIGVSVKPKKGSAVFWYNLHKSGDGDKHTEHGACPVLVGSKWISNKWLHEVGQEFLRPCVVDQPLLERVV